MHSHRDERPRRDHGGRARRRRQRRQDGRAPPRHRQGRRPRGRGSARRDRRVDRAEGTSCRCKVVNGIAAHHQEVEYACLEAPIVQVADAISASPARRPRRDDGDVRQAPRGPPGHRRELRRASSARSPSRPGARSASSSGPTRSTTCPRRRLARDIVKKIEEQLTYPGQIKVTVIRETRAVEYAK